VTTQNVWSPVYVDALVLRDVNSGSAGTLDSSFGTSGTVTTDFDSYSSLIGLAIQPDGKVVIAGTSGSDFALARYNPDGTLDTSFGTDGEVTTDFTTSDGANSLVLQPDGKIVVAGQAWDSTISGHDFAVVRYNADGSLDTGFGTDGMVHTDFGGGSTANSIVLQPDGKMIVAGYAFSTSTNDDFALARYDTDGSLDSTFGDGGKLTTDFGGSWDHSWFGSYDSANSVALQSDGKIVVAGEAFKNNGPNNYIDMALARYDTDGSLDSTFGDGGKLIVDSGSSDAARELAVQADGKIIVAGIAVDGNGAAGFVVASLNSDGTLNTGFGTGEKCPQILAIQRAPVLLSWSRTVRLLRPALITAAVLLWPAITPMARWIPASVQTA
jgi:uncharacterized delta-60 repeat protein